MKCFRNGVPMSETDKMVEYYNQFKVTCKCGHVLVISPRIGKLLCNHCGHYAYIDKKLEFKDKLKKELNK